MWGFQGFLGSSGKQSCALSWAPLGSLNTSPSPAAGMRWRKTVLLQETSLSPHIYPRPNYVHHLHTHTLLRLCHISTLSSEILIFFLSFLFPSPLSHGWMKPQKANKNTHTPQPHCIHPLHNDSNFLTAFEASTPLKQRESTTAQMSQAKTSQTPKNLRLHYDLVPVQAACTNPPPSPSPGTLTRLWSIAS